MDNTHMITSTDAGKAFIGQNPTPIYDLKELMAKWEYRDHTST